MMEVAGEDFESQPLPDRIILDDVEQVVRRHLIDVRTEEGFSLLVGQVGSSCVRAPDAIECLRSFCWTEPRLPDASAKRSSAASRRRRSRWRWARRHHRALRGAARSQRAGLDDDAVAARIHDLEDG